MRPELEAIGCLVPVWYDDDIRPGHRWNDDHDGATLWANAFDRDLADVFELQDEPTRRIVG